MIYMFDVVFELSRLALDDGHSTVVATCARAIQALFSYASNESYFDCLEVLIFSFFTACLWYLHMWWRPFDIVLFCSVFWFLV